MPADGRTPSPTTVGADTQVLELRIENLLPSKVYTVSVQAVSGTGDDSTLSEVRTMAFTTGTLDNILFMEFDIESIYASKRNRPQLGFAPVVFNNQIELERDTIV